MRKFTITVTSAAAVATAVVATAVTPILGGIAFMF